MAKLQQALIGKTITGVIAHPEQDDAGRPMVYMLALDDGSFVEFVSPAARAGRVSGVPRLPLSGSARRGSQRPSSAAGAAALEDGPVQLALA